ncbi:MAG: hypothetical protein FWF23_04280 [Alphaproteobacteria bacterium]|nr:hypothetical protein [Alphaproteobacteria bacterium]MCL2505024.1 hypothetical protein [Alphaproteobacteria bacterium]
MNEIIARLAYGTQRAKEIFEANAFLYTSQSPKIAVVGCSDSRVPTDLLFDALPGEIFTFRNIGASLEDENNHSELSSDAKKFITYANHIGIENIVIIPHGNCGCIANAIKCAGSSCACGHGQGLEADILKDMGKKKGFTVSAMQKEEAADYLKTHNIPAGSDPDKTFARAVEVGHGFHQALLVKEHLAKLDSKIKVHVVYFDVSTCTSYIAPDGESRFEKIEICNQSSCGCGCSGCG